MNERHEDSAVGLFRAISDGSLTRRQMLGRASAVGLVLGTSGLLAACTRDPKPDDSKEPENTAPTFGGVMRIALPAGAAGSLDPHAPASLHARLRNTNVFDTLYAYSGSGQLVPSLAEEATPNSDATEWTIRLKSGVEFHDGSTLTADDVIYSLRRILDPETGAEGTGQIGMVDAAGLTKVDDLTVLVPLTRPFSIFLDQLAAGHVISIIKNGETRFEQPNGTGAFKFVSGNDSEFTLERNPNYWISGLPYLDGVEVIPIQDPTARLNALKTDEVDAIHPVELSQAAALGASASITQFTNKTATFMPMYMRVDGKPFSDNRVREALKFAADREKMNELAYGGEGVIGNDMLSAVDDPGYPTGVEQRPFDPDRAKALWEEAGMGGSTVEFWTSGVWPGQVTAATVFAQQAKQAGINIEVKKSPEDQFISKVYGIKPFANDYWKFTPALTIMSLTFVPDADYFATASWASPETTSLYEQAVAQGDEAKRQELTQEINTRFASEGPYINWGYEASPDLYSSRIGGQENNVIRGLNGFRLEKFFVKS